MDFEKIRIRIYEAEAKGTREKLREGDAAVPWGPAWIDFAQTGLLPVHPRCVFRGADAKGLKAFGEDLAEYRKRDADLPLGRAENGGVRVKGLAGLSFPMRVDAFVAALQLVAEDEKAV